MKFFSQTDPAELCPTDIMYLNSLKRHSWSDFRQETRKIRIRCRKGRFDISEVLKFRPDSQAIQLCWPNLEHFRRTISSFNKLIKILTKSRKL